MNANINNLAPIILFVYNRPWHTQQTLEALQKNDLADQSELFIYADGARNPEAQTKVNEVRAYIKTITGFKNITIIERDKNLGLADNIVDGVTKIVNQYGKIIVLEDDIVTSVVFLNYMNQALTIYEKEDRVMHISGYMFPLKKKMPETFFYNTASCWGWGTWSRAWKYYSSDAKYLLSELYSNDLHYKFNLNGAYKFTDQLIDNITKKNNTWAIKWYASFFLKSGLALHPYPSFTRNIGNDGTGVNSKSENKYDWEKLNKEPKIKKLRIFDDSLARSEMIEFYKTDSTNRQPLKKIIKLLTPPILLNLVKKKKQHSKFQEEKIRLQKLPRYFSDQTNIMGKKISFPDAASFLFIYEELFTKEIYKFNSFSYEPYIIDAGANIGLSVIYFKQLYPQSKIIAFEPDHEIFEFLEVNVRSFELENVNLIKRALWNELTTLEFSSEGADAGKVDSNIQSLKKVKVETDLMSKYINRNVDLLKIDIEGSELKVLEECKEKLHLVNNLFVEYHSFIHKKQELHKLLKIIHEAGFRISVSSPGYTSLQPFIKRSSYLEMDFQLNIYCYRN